ncbi:hypothetical protein ACFW9I_30385 [[Kitasatospora] papulosa]|uniref:hypothetical protein n=1 Tax=[Kitasatospora] papulosa TaxID=1464011 RepID=UPI0036B49E1A
MVAKSLTGLYRPGVRGWTKVRRRNTTEALIGGITGSLRRPQVLLLGRYDTTGRLRLVGKTAPLKPGAARDLAEHLTTDLPRGRRHAVGADRPRPVPVRARGGDPAGRT